MRSSTGLFSGDVTHLRQALTAYSATTNQRRADGIKKVNAEGGKISAVDYAFGNWEARTDYTAEMYEA